jgi:undecaprenyl-diphosphatase
LEWFQAVVLGLIQGIVEFLPISSSAHLRIVPELFGWPDPGAPFTAVTQIGSAAAIILYFAKDIGRITSAWTRSLRNWDALRSDALVPAGQPGGSEAAGRHRRRSWDPADARLGWFVIIGTIPIVVAGVLLKDVIENEFRSLWIVGATFVILGLALWFADRYGRREHTVRELTLRDAALVGIAQIGALIPGVSRSGATMSMALLLGYRRDDAARFALLLAIPAIIGAGVFEWSEALGDEAVYAIGPTLLATAVAFVSSYATVAWLLRWLQTRTYTPFVVYRVVGGLVILGLLAGGVLTP